MKKLFFTLFTSIIFITGCTSPKKPTIKGEILNNKKTSKISLIELEDGYNVIDYANPKKNAFSFDSSFSDTKLLQIRTDDYSVANQLFFYEPKLHYEIAINNKTIKITAPKNSLQYKYNHLLSKIKPFEEKLEQISQDTTLTKTQLNELSTKYFSKILDTKKNYIKKQPESYISLYLLKNLVEMESVLSFYELESFFDIINVKAHKKSPLLDFIENKLEALKRNRIIGKYAPSFSLKNPQGKKYSIENFRGKYILLDFWASWCAPCRVENKKIRQLYKKYKDKDFTIVSISFDNNKEKWIKAIKEDKIPWVHISDLKGFNKSEMRNLYKINSLPTTYIIDKEGKVIDQDLTHNELEKVLKKIYP